MKKYISILFLLIILLVGCSNDNSITYKLEIIDIDGRSLGSYKIKTDNPNSFFDDLKNKCDVKYEDSTYGAYLTQINDSIIDDNYFLAIYENGTQALVGVEGIVIDNNDEFKIVVENFTNFDDTDLLVDKIVYGFYKNAKELYKNQSYCDYYLIASFDKLIDLGYDLDLSFLNDNIKNSFKNLDYSNMSMTDLFKNAVSLSALDMDLTQIKESILNKNYASGNQEYSEGINALYYCLMNKLDTKPNNYSTFTSYFNDYIKNPTVGDSAFMASHAFTYIPDFSEYKELYITKQLSIFTDKGVDSYGFGVSAASTAQAIIAFCNIGENIRDTKYQINNTDMVKALLTYFEDDYTVLGYDGKTDLLFNTPQAVSALMCYKALRDKKVVVNIYA